MSEAEQPRAPDLIRRRHVFYVAGYDPQGADGYYAVFQREFDRFKKLWPMRGTLTRPEAEAGAHATTWKIETEAPNWKVLLDYEFLDWGDIVRRDLARPMSRSLPRVLLWLASFILSGALFRTFYLSWRFGTFVLFTIIAFAAWFAAAAAGGWLVWGVLSGPLGLPSVIAGIAGLICAALLFDALRPVADRWHINHLIKAWLFFFDYLGGRRGDFEQRMEKFAARLVAAVRAGEADEIVIVGHSGGTISAPLVVEKALAIDPDLGRRGVRVVLMTIGSVIPFVGIYPGATVIHGVIRRLAMETGVRWFDFQSRQDVLNFYPVHPVADLAIDAGSGPPNPVIFHVNLREMLTAEAFARFRWNFFRVHFQFIMANDRPARYDFFLYLCGPLPLSFWIERRISTGEAYSPDASLRPEFM